MVATRVPRITKGCIVALTITLTRLGCRFQAGHEFRVLTVDATHAGCLPSGTSIIVRIPLEQLELVHAVQSDTRKRDTIQSLLRSGKLIRGTDLRGN